MSLKAYCKEVENELLNQEGRFIDNGRIVKIGDPYQMEIQNI